MENSKKASHNAPTPDSKIITILYFTEVVVKLFLGRIFLNESNAFNGKIQFPDFSDQIQIEQLYICTFPVYFSKSLEN